MNLGSCVVEEGKVARAKLAGREFKLLVGPEGQGCKNMCVGVTFFPPTSHAPGHIHDKQEEIVYVLKGHGEIYLDGVPAQIGEGSTIYVPPGVEHSVRNMDAQEMKVLFAFSPPVIQGTYQDLFRAYHEPNHHES